MQIDHLVKPGGSPADLKLWHCPTCKRVHMAVGKTTVNFEAGEFAQFVAAVADVQASAWMGGESSLARILDRTEGAAH